MHCFNATSGQPPSHGPFNLDGVQTFPGNIDSDIDVDFDASKAEHPEGETPAWGSCGRIVAQERADFFEFMACNIIFAAIALFVLFARSKRLRLRQARQLAARIGMVHAAPSCGLVPPKPVSHSSAQVVNSTDDVVAAMWWPGWRNAEQPPNKISWSKYNVATYAFALPTENGSLSMPDDPDNVILPQFVSLAQENNVKALVSIGGYTGSRFFSALVNPDNRTNFVNTCYEFMTNNSLDGLDFDWEYPGGGGMSCNLASGNDSNNLFAFIHELRAKMGSDKMITLSVRATPFTDTDGDLSGLAADVDHIAIMDYDIWGSWSPTTGPNAPLDDSCAATKAGSATSSVREWSATNFPVDKIVLGVPAYGHGFNVSSTNALTANNSISVYASFTGIPFGPNDNATATPQREF
ncbi:hypothetical protein C0989_010769 [Termitomyces sp. Mn162]|nr:hypothetical protein C0989_010769 [Termitomyces sp. Mn162]